MGGRNVLWESGLQSNSHTEMSIKRKGLNHKELLVVRRKEIEAEANNLKHKCQRNRANFVSDWETWPVRGYSAGIENLS
jgi:hypothetical protein